jgi:hypothetical protein
MTLDPSFIKKKSEEIIRSYGGKVNTLLEQTEFTRSRPPREIIERTAIVSVMMQIYFGIETSAAKQWIDDNHLTYRLSPSESEILQKQNKDLTEDEQTNLYWYIEALWAFFWIGSYITDLSIDKPVQDCVVQLMPHVYRDGDYQILNKMFPRQDEELYQMADLYYRCHWIAENAHQNGQSSGFLSIDVMMERRKALLWTIHPHYNWDSVPLSWDEETITYSVPNTAQIPAFQMNPAVAS